ncbi:ABC transporter permease [Candidatus Kaiserbacteria bacterium]|nr:ABC transporter permease [Candidatus Kaiserbacteria bacterium]
MWTACKRIIKAGVVGFWRDAFVSFTSVLVITVALFMVATTLFNNHALEVALEDLEEKVDINIYFTITATEEEITAFQGLLEGLPEVAEVTYTSRSQALEEFRARHEGDELIIKGLKELDDNPLGASLSVRAKETSQYEGIATFVVAQHENPPSGTSIIDRVNYNQNKKAISRLNDIINSTRNDNTTKAILLIAIALFVSFNTIRLAIHNAREEIGVMRLVGASNTFISMPFMVSGILQGLIAGVLVVLLLYPALIFYESAFYPFPFFDEAGYGKLLFGYFVINFAAIFFTIVGSGILIGAISSFLAVRRYLRI